MSDSSKEVFPKDLAPSQWNERLQKTWNARAHDWDRMSSENADALDRQSELDRIADQLHLKPGSRLLDAGCGTGQFAIAFAQRGLDVVGIDLAPEMIKRARQNAEIASVGVDWRVADMTALESDVAAFDAIHARVVLQFTHQPDLALNRFRELLRPSGGLFVSIPGDFSPIYTRSWRRHLRTEAPPLNYMNPRELEKLLVHLDWEITDEWGSMGRTMSGSENQMAGIDVSQLPISLQRASSTTWAFVAKPRE